MAQMKEQNKAPEKQLIETEIVNLSDAEFKTLVIRMLKELTGYCNSIKKTQAEMKVTLSEIRKNLQETNNEGDDAKIQINNLEHKEEISIKPEQQEEKRIKKNKDGIRSSWDISKCTNIWIIGVPEGEEKSKKLEIYLKK